MASMTGRLAVMLSVVSLTACAETSGDTVDCDVAIRIGDETYTSVTVTDKQPSEQFGTALESTCNDVGPRASGQAFDEESQKVQAWTFDEFSYDRVVGVRLADSWQVFVANSVEKSDRDKIASSFTE